MTPEDRLAAAGLGLPEAHPVVANYAMTARAGSLLFVSGHGSFVEGAPVHTGRLGQDLSTAEGAVAARAVTLNLLSTLKAQLGELARVRVVKIVVFVNAAPSFTEHHLVANGATDLLVLAFGNEGRPARSAVGMSSLPFNFAVEVEAVVEVRT